MREIVLASNNQGKLTEIQAALSGLDFGITCQADHNLASVPETGSTFVENALIKARYVAEHTGLASLADDSGLVVESLNGEPGIYSARYAGEESNDHKNCLKLLKKLEEQPETPRTAYFYCIMVLLRHASDPTPIICEGRWPGIIAKDFSGLGGFGYDPIFFLPELNCTAAELTLEQKNQMSHRGKALQQLKQQLLA